MTHAITAMPRYERYKDSVIEWLGDIPESWEIKKLKFFGNIFAGLTDKKGIDFEKEYKEKFSKFIPFTSIANDTKVKKNYQYVSVKKWEKQNLVVKEDILFLMSSETLEDIGKCSIYEDTENSLYLNSFCKGFRIKKYSLHSYYANYLLSSDIYRNYFAQVARGFTRINLKQEYIKNTFIFIPPLSEQTAIAKFLDEKTVQIDEAIGIKQQQIALLKERKQIIIQNAVTKGLNAGAPMKDSGVDWIGDIPAHWECSAVKRFLSMPITDGPHTTPELVDTGVPFISAEAIKDGQIDFNKKRGDINKKDHDDFCKKYRPKKGDVYMVKSGATTGNVAIVETDQEFSIWSPLAVFRSNDDALSNLYLYMTLQSSYFFKGVELNWSFGTQQNIGMGILGNLPITVPPKTEQMEIYKHIKDQLIGLNEVIRLQQAQINKLKEYKASLINSAVTGKVKVI